MFRRVRIAQILHRSSVEVRRDPSDDFVGGNHVHAPREAPDGVHAQCFRSIFFVAVPEWDGAGFPAAAIVATSERSNGVDDLMVRVCVPVRRLTSSRDNDGGPVLRHAFFRRHRRREMHEQAHRREYALRVVDEPN